jgi:hypothetical protein
MNRRLFLQRFASGLIGASLVDVQWVPTAQTIALPTINPAKLTTIDEITAEMVRLMAAEWHKPRATALHDRAYRLGERGLTTQFGIDMRFGPDEAVHAEAHLLQVAARLTTYAKDLNVTAFAALPVPHDLKEVAVASDERTGLVVRGIRWFDIYEEPQYRIRFDMLGAPA